MASSANYWQPVDAPGDGEPEASPPPSRDGATNSSASSVKRFGTSLSWKSWTKRSRMITDKDKPPHFLTACNHGWKPYTMRKRVLVPMAIWTAALAAVIEFFAQKSSREGGLSLSRTVDDIPKVARLSYEFLPTILAVILSIAWTWIDLDVKRIQPWLALSKDGGARVQDSLTLDYPYDFVALAPYKSAKRRHWPVFVSGTVMVLIFWVVTPLQGAIFGTGPVQLHESTAFYTSQDLLPIEEQSALIDTSVLHHMYAIKYLGQSYPPFTTPEYALRPFKLQTDSTPGSKNWTATTTKFWTDLDCQPAHNITARTNEWKGCFDYDNGKGCNASLIATVKGMKGYDTYHMHYYGWYTSAYVSQAIGVPTCPSEFSNNFLAVMTKGDLEDLEMTALFCETSYWKQRVTVTVPDNNFRPDNASITPAGPVEVLPDTEFNTTGFEYLLSSSVSEVQDVRRDYPRNLIVDQFDRVNDTGVQYPLDTMVGFAIGGRERPLDDYLDKDVMGNTYRDIHKYAFSLTYNSLLTEATASNETSEGSVEFIMHGVIVSRVFSAIVEGLLLAIGVCCIILLVLSARTRSNLSSDPAGLGDQMSVLRNSHDLLYATFRESRFLDEKASTALENTKLHLRCACYDPDAATTIAVTGLPTLLPQSSRDNSPSRDVQDDHYTPVRPLVLRRVSGIAFSVLLVAALAGLLALRIQEQKLGGLPRPSERFEVLQLLENYIPTAIATLIEPYWVLVNRMLCIFLPFEDLHKPRKPTHAKEAMKAKYASMPPQLTFWAALRSGHVLLPVVCAVALLGNVLAVGLGGLFSEEPMRASYPVDLQYSQSHEFDLRDPHGFSTQGRQNDNFFGIEANITFNTPMPPWVTKEYYFQPFAASSPSEHNSTETFDGRTRGYGIDIACEEMTPYRRVDEIDIMDYRPVMERHGLSGPTCQNFHNITWAGMVDNGTTALEDASELCHTLLVYWGRSASDPVKDRDMRYFNCRPSFRTALFNVSIDARGHVLSYNQSSEFEDSLGYGMSKNHTETLMDMTLRNMATGVPRWHNDTYSYAWFSDVIKLAHGTRFLDPSEPLPEPSYVLPMVEEIWKKSFTYLLSSSDIVNYALPEENQQPFTGTRSVTETRIFMSEAAFIVSATILVLYIIVAVVLYGFSVKSLVPKMPTSIGAVLDFTAASKAVREYSPEIDAQLRFGRYVGVDGKKHTGLEYSELVMPIDTASPSSAGEKDDPGVRRRWFWRRRGESEKQDRPLMEE